MNAVENLSMILCRKKGITRYDLLQTKIRLSLNNEENGLFRVLPAVFHTIVMFIYKTRI
jgi:hypothetical protein